MTTRHIRNDDATYTPPGQRTISALERISAPREVLTESGVIRLGDALDEALEAATASVDWTWFALFRAVFLAVARAPRAFIRSRRVTVYRCQMGSLVQGRGDCRRFGRFRIGFHFSNGEGAEKFVCARHLPQVSCWAFGVHGRGVTIREVVR